MLSDAASTRLFLRRRSRGQGHSVPFRSCAESLHSTDRILGLRSQLGLGLGLGLGFGFGVGIRPSTPPRI